MSVLQGESVGAAQGSPMKKNRLSLKFFQKKETKRALDFSEPQAEEPKTEPHEPESSSCEQVVFGPLPCPASPGLPVSCEKKDHLVPFVGFNNLGNTCYLNSILQVLYYCPGFRDGIKNMFLLSKREDKLKKETDQSEEPQCQQSDGDVLPAHIELLGSFNSVISSVEQLQSNYLLNPESFSEGELATPPCKILNMLRQLNPMYEGHLQHDAQEVLQCILGYIQEACDTIRKVQDLEKKDDDVGEVKTEDISTVPCCSEAESKPSTDEDGQVSVKRKSDTEVGNAKKKPKSVKCKKSDSAEENVCRNVPFTRSKRKSSSDVTAEHKDKEEEKKLNKEEGNGKEEKTEKVSKETDGKIKKRAKLGWLRSSGKQPSIFSKFCSVGKISSTTAKNENKAELENEVKDKPDDTTGQEMSTQNSTEKHQDVLGLMEKLFQGRLVLRTRCLECEGFTERREDFQDISVPVLDDQPSSPDDLSEVSPDPKPELKTLKWAIAQFASVERIVGEDKYFCETCHHYTEAERSLLFDKTPQVITIHLKRFSASSLELDPYAGLCKVNTPLQTPLTLSLEEWCTEPSSAHGQQYQLFAVVMHSGVTISSGHYTTYIRMSGLKEVKLWPEDKKEAQVETCEKESKEQAPKDGNPDYNDGEVSFSLKARGQRRASLANTKSGNKKLSEGGVGLLGGQKSLSSVELANGSKQAEKAAGRRASEGSKRRKTINRSGLNTDGGLKTEPKAAEEPSVGSSGGLEAADQQPLNHLLQYEGKWLLFDDSEVRLFEEEDFLQTCSPKTCSSSTPYLLFYRKMPECGQ
ncbi:ubiquitin carboxyl-terminal hydrolase 1 [Nematolebias whitei]|uniref:ubiquitin carboxyl-terminal hydrolase 1 n=1 Tax=Nematolebias whitei TaxID=451745 RepID=UPI00189952D7|nr:ubiquitin carboxyl-terminal hydrolase 1 [Nematolebias whitei]